jgi:diguanylate cyclase (GGDEF)-like protein
MSEAGPFGEEREICCTMTSVVVKLVRSIGGEAAVRATLVESGTAHHPAFLENTDNWISLAEAVALLEAGIKVTGDPDFARRVGADAVRQHSGTQVATLLRSLGSPEAVLNGITTTAAKFSTVSELKALEAVPGRAVVRAVARPGYKRVTALCDWTTGLLSSPTMLFGLPPAYVEEVECQARGGSECRYVVTWDEESAAEASDPEKRVTSLEAQVIAMADRLENVYATASDLVSTDDLDSVLARIVKRAANAVRAPGFVLAVRAGAEEDMRVFSEGLSHAEALRIAETADAGDDQSDAMLAVTVASSRRDYGRLVAVHPAGMRFFPQEKQLLSLYAKHAAAVLDTAIALEEASRRHRDVSALLSLSQQLAQAGTTDEIAARLSEAVRGVVDCDRASVWIWDDEQACLRREGAHGREFDQARATLVPGSTPHLDQMLSDPQPMFFGPEDEDPLLEAIMTDARLVSLAVVPILAREIFLGLLTVGVRDRAERLRRSPDLLERLAGVAALAAPALQNGRLIDELERQAIQDGLTGLLNRRGFGRSIDEVLAGVAESGRNAGLLFIDLDAFKDVNDTLGHPVGDELIRSVTLRLSRSLRGDDLVARLGGDEFAVILGHVSSPADLQAAAGRAQSALSAPFEIEGVSVSVTASVGVAMAPENGTTIDVLVRHADQAMYREKTLARAAA